MVRSLPWREMQHRTGAHRQGAAGCWLPAWLGHSHLLALLHTQGGAACGPCSCSAQTLLAIRLFAATVILTGFTLAPIDLCSYVAERPGQQSAMPDLAPASVCLVTLPGPHKRQSADCSLPLSTVATCLLMQIHEIVRQAPRKRQTMLFSATMTEQVQELVTVSLQRPVRLAADPSSQAPVELTQEIVRLKVGFLIWGRGKGRMGTVFNCSFGAKGGKGLCRSACEAGIS